MSTGAIEQVKTRTHGQTLLLESGASLQKIADSCQVSKPTATAWRRGRTIPQGPKRVLLAESFGIPANAWEKAGGVAQKPIPKLGRPPRRKQETQLAKERKKPGPKPPKMRPPYPKAPDIGRGMVTQVEHSLRCIRYDLEHEDLGATQKSKLRSDEARNMNLLAKLRRERELTEDRYVREHPAFVRLVERIVGALEKHPDALRDVLQELKG